MRRRRSRRRGDVDDWLMTYADMITLLLCFFAVFLSVSEPKKEKFERARDAVIQKFGVPDASPKQETSENASRSMSMEQEEMTYNALPSIVDHFEDNKGPGVKGGQPAAIPADKPADTAKKAGDRIVTLEMNSAPFFPSGTAALSDEGKKILDDVLKTINSDQYKDYTVTVEGHTDDNPINTPQFPSNWELSTGRAAAVVRYFLQQGVTPARLRASGYADTFPKVPNRDASGNPIPANQAQNRRVIVKLERVDKDQQK